VEGVVEVGIKEQIGIGNREDWNDFRTNGEEEHLGVFRKNLDDSSPPQIVFSGVRVIGRPCIKVVKGISLFDGEVLRLMTKMTLAHNMPLNTTHLTNIYLTIYTTWRTTLRRSRLKPIYFLK